MPIGALAPILLTTAWGEAIYLRRLLRWLACYVCAGPTFIISYYFITATPLGRPRILWTPVTVALLLSYVVANPLILDWHPEWRKNHLSMRSLGAGRSTHTYVNLKQDTRDDAMNLLVFLFERGLMMWLALPILLILVIGSLKTWHSPR